MTLAKSLKDYGKIKNKWVKIRDDKEEIIYSLKGTYIKLGVFKIKKGEFKNKWFPYKSTSKSITRLAYPFGTTKSIAIKIIKSYMKQYY